MELAERCVSSLLRRRSHYGRNDGDGDGTVTFRRSHYTLRTVTVTVTADRGRDNGCHGDGHGDVQSDGRRGAKKTFGQFCERRRKRWLQERRERSPSGTPTRRDS